MACDPPRKRARTKVSRTPAYGEEHSTAGCKEPSPPAERTVELAAAAGKQHDAAPARPDEADCKAASTATKASASSKCAAAPAQTVQADAAAPSVAAKADTAAAATACTHRSVPFLRLTSDSRPSQAVSSLIYLDRDEVTFGRLPNCNVVLDSKRVPQMISRLHARIRRMRRQSDQEPGDEAAGPLEDWWELRDNKSMNGVLVNGQPVGTDGHELVSGDIIVFGRKMVPPEFEFAFEASSMAGPAQEQPAKTPMVEEAFAEQARQISDLQKELNDEREKRRLESEQKQAQRQNSAVELSDLHSELICSICQDWLVHSATLECAHTFCGFCGESWLLQKKFECPVCRKGVTREPVKSWALDAIVQKSVDKLPAQQQEEYRERVQQADEARAKAKKLHDELERSVNAALKKGKNFFKIDSNWTRKEKETFKNGINDYTGDARASYCRLTNLTQQWIHSADFGKLNTALHNLNLPSFVDKTEEEIRQRLLMYLRYG